MTVAQDLQNRFAQSLEATAYKTVINGVELAAVKTVEGTIDSLKEIDAQNVDACVIARCWITFVNPDPASPIAAFEYSAYEIIRILRQTRTLEYSKLWLGAYPRIPDVNQAFTEGANHCYDGSGPFMDLVLEDIPSAICKTIRDESLNPDVLIHKAHFNEITKYTQPFCEKGLKIVSFENIPPRNEAFEQFREARCISMKPDIRATICSFVETQLDKDNPAQFL